MRGEVDVLVATTVIEVGVDVPNASLMVIEHAERFGLAQLHQLRGRVGRGAAESTCVLLFEEPLTDTAKQRLKVIYENTDGFEIARQDLLIRGPGEFLGARQSGVPLLRFADIERDVALIEQARDAAEELLRTRPAGRRSASRPLARAASRRSSRRERDRHVTRVNELRAVRQCGCGKIGQGNGSIRRLTPVAGLTPIMSLYTLGLNHTTAPLDVRERVDVRAGRAGRRAARACIAGAMVKEAAILSTCNRTEVYFHGGEPDARRALARGRPPAAARPLAPYVYTLPREQAVTHAFRVASGLDSMVLGEPQILGQMKQAVRTRGSRRDRSDSC